MATQETIKQLNIGGVLRDVEDTTARGRIDELQTALADKIDAVEGKDLSTNDFTTALKTKLENIAAGAQVNTIEGIQVNGTDVQPDSTTKKVNITTTAGKSAYQVAVDNGFSGNEAAWLASLKGRDGNDGVASGDEVVVVNSLDGTPTDLEQGQVAVLGAGQGKVIGDRLDEIDVQLNDVFGGEVEVTVNGNRVTLEIGASASEPRLIINAYGTAFTETELNTSKTKHFTLTGRKLAANANISVTSGNAAFTLSTDNVTFLPTVTLNADNNGKVAQYIYVKFTPTSETSYTGVITATCGVATATTTYSGTGAAEVVPAITLDCNVDTITTDAIGNAVTLQFVVYGSNLTEAIALTAAVSPAGSTVTLDYNSVSAADAENGKLVTLTFTPSDVDDDTITITASSDGATTQTLAITGKVVLPPAVDDIIVVDGLHYKVTTASTSNTQGTVKVVRDDDSETGTTSSGYTGDITIPDTITKDGYVFKVTAIAAYAFYNANIGKVTIGNYVTRLIGYSFSNSKVTEIVADKVTTITAYAINGEKLTKLVLGADFTSFGNGALYGQSNLKDITFKSTTPPTISSDWPTLSGVTLRVPSASISAYEAASPWNDTSIYTITAITE